MKIAMIGHKRVPGGEGGVEIVVEELAVHMAEQGHEVTLYNRAAKGYTKIKEYKGCRIITVPTINKKSLDAVIYSFFATVHALFCGYDIMHYHALGPSVMLAIPNLFGIKTVATVHGLDWQRAKWGGFGTKYLKFGEKIIAKYAKEVIVLSKNVQQYFESKYDRKTNFIPNGIIKPTLREPDIIKQKYGLNGQDYFLFLARIVPEKGLHYLMDAYAQIETDKKLVIAGGDSHSGSYYTEICERACLDKNIIMTGFVQGAEKDELFTNCAAYILPSDIEGMPISFLEAMSYSCKCVVSDIAENTEIANENTLYFKQGNVPDLKEKLQTDLKQMINRYATQPEYDTWPQVVEKTVQLYDKKGLK